MKRERLFLYLIFMASLFQSSCVTKQSIKELDKEVYDIIERKKEKVKNEKMRINLSEGTYTETIVLTLKDALRIASEKNREYQTMKENVYISVLNFLSERYKFQPQLNLSGDITWNEGENLISNLNLNLIKVLSTGGRINLNLLENIIRYFSGEKEEAFRSILSFNLFQPLFKGAGRKVAMENLIQSERDIVYQIRDFLRYQKSFSIDITRDYLNLILSKKMMENYYLNYLNVKTTRERIEMLSEAGRIATFQVDQARQNEYNAYQNWIKAYANYENSLVSFKIKLGISPSVKIALEDSEIEKLFEQPLPEIKLNAEEFINYALLHRLDLINEYEKFEDSKRKLEVVLNNIKNEVNISASVKSEGDKKTRPNIELNEFDYTMELNFEIPLNKFPQKRDYKTALIQFDRAKRNFEKKVDTVKKEIMDSVRNLEESYQSYKIQLNSLKLAERRIESTDLLLQAGRATTRDLLDSQEAYIRAKNDLVGSISRFLIECLNFLYITEKFELDDLMGVWKGDLNEAIKNF